MLQVKTFKVTSELRAAANGVRETTLASESEKVLGAFLKNLEAEDIVQVIQTVEGGLSSHGGMAFFTIIYKAPKEAKGGK